jgi:hypothetical protein
MRQAALEGTLQTNSADEPISWAEESGYDLRGHGDTLIQTVNEHDPNVVWLLKSIMPLSQLSQLKRRFNSQSTVIGPLPSMDTSMSCSKSLAMVHLYSKAVDLTRNCLSVRSGIALKSVK